MRGGNTGGAGERVTADLHEEMALYDRLPPRLRARLASALFMFSVARTVELLERIGEEDTIRAIEQGEARILARSGTERPGTEPVMKSGRRHRSALPPRG